MFSQSDASLHWCAQYWQNKTALLSFVCVLALAMMCSFYQRSCFHCFQWCVGSGPDAMLFMWERGTPRGRLDIYWADQSVVKQRKSRVHFTICFLSKNDYQVKFISLRIFIALTTVNSLWSQQSKTSTKDEQKMGWSSSRLRVHFDCSRPPTRNFAYCCVCSLTDHSYDQCPFLALRPVLYAT